MITARHPASTSIAGGNLACECAFGLPVHVLRGDGNGCAFAASTAAASAVKGGATRMSQWVDAGHERCEGREIGAGFRLRLVHLPIPRDYVSSHGASSGRVGVPARFKISST